MGSAGKLTIISVVYNAAEALEETILSVRENAVLPYDYIIIDGGSTDGTLEVIRQHDDLLTFWTSEPDRGVYDAMNKGWLQADSESWILFLGAGDRLLSLPTGGLAAAGNRKILYGNVLLENGQVFHSSADYRLKLYNTLHHQALLVPKQLHPEPPFNLDYKLYADFDFNQKMYKQGIPFRFMPGLKSFAAPGGLTSDLDMDELKRVISLNYGQIWSGLSFLGFSMVRIFPWLNKFKPIV